jgi:hypothetical protein
LCEETVAQQSLYIHSIGIRNPTNLPCRHTGDLPSNSPLAEFRFLFLKQAKQRPIDVAETEQAEIVGPND